MAGTIFILMLKAPRFGQVKTRLAKEIGPEKALAIYRRLVAWQLQQLETLVERQPAAQVEICYTPTDAEDEMRAWLGSSYAYAPQSEGDLGDRLQAALTRVLEPGAERVIFLGGDCPFATKELLLQAEAALAEHDVTVAPAKDGGYYLIGLAGHHPAVFHQITWGSERVMEETLTRVDEAGLKLFLLPEARDVDTLADWQAAVTAFPELEPAA